MTIGIKLKLDKSIWGILGYMLFAFIPLSAAAAPTGPCEDYGIGGNSTIVCKVGSQESEDSFLQRNIFRYFFSGYAQQGNDSILIDGGKISYSSGIYTLPPPYITPYVPIDGSIQTLQGDDIVEITAGSVGAERDTFGLGRSRVDFRLGEGNDTFTISGGQMYGDVLGEAGDDRFLTTGGTFVGEINGGTGNDTVTLSGGSVTGNLVAKTVKLFGGTLKGDVSGLINGTLEINDSRLADPLRFGDHVSFSGVNAVGNITNTHLDASGFSQTFDGFFTLSLVNSTTLLTSDQRVDGMSLFNGSTLFVRGQQTINSQAVGGLGTLSLVNSNLNMINGVANDQLTVGGLTLNNANILIDYDPTGGSVDSLVVDPTAGLGVTVSNANRIYVNLLGTPVLNEAMEVSIIKFPAGIDPASFSIEGIMGAPSGLYDYTIISGDDGDLLLRAAPTSKPLAAPIPISNSAALAVSLNQLNDVTATNATSILGLSSRAGSRAGSPFLLFATGQVARTHYDGFKVTGTSDIAPSFSSTEFSAAASVDFNMSEYLSLDQEFGLNIGVFGGYATSNVDLGSYLGYATAGSAFNKSALFGSYGLLKKGNDYLIVSGIGILGETDVRNSLLGSSGSYDTRGMALTASVGHIFALTDEVRFDLRGGILGAKLTGDAYTDNIGVQYSKSTLSFGGVKFEPGIYANYMLENSVAITPYLRAEFQQLFAYKNNSKTGGKNYEYDVPTFSTVLSAGMNVIVSDSLTVNGEIRAKTSGGGNSIAGKFGLKISF